MPRRDANKAVTAKMYRHFAVVTIIATAALAIATSDSSADQLNSGIDSQQAELKAAGKQLGKDSQPKIVRRVGNVKKAPPAATGWGADEGGASDVGGESSSYVPAAIAAVSVSPDLLRKLNLTAEQFHALSSEDKVKLLGKVRSNGLVSEQEEQRRQQAVAAVSLERSGFEGSCSDC